MTSKKVGNFSKTDTQWWWLNCWKEYIYFTREQVVRRLVLVHGPSQLLPASQPVGGIMKREGAGS